jgi:ADP-ribosylation factor-like protein 6
LFSLSLSLAHLCVRVCGLLSKNKRTFSVSFFFCEREEQGTTTQGPEREMGAAASVKKQGAKEKEDKTLEQGTKLERKDFKEKKKKRESFIMTMARAFGFLKEKASVIVIGLDNSGKTTLLHCLQESGESKKFFESTPTIGFAMETFRRGKLDFKCFDMSGQGKYRSLWETYYKDTQAIIWVIDSTDHFRMCEVKDELETTLNHPDIKDSDISILLFANKVRFSLSLSLSLSLHFKYMHQSTFYS